MNTSITPHLLTIACATEIIRKRANNRLLSWKEEKSDRNDDRSRYSTVTNHSRHEPNQYRNITQQTRRKHLRTITFGALLFFMESSMGGDGFSNQGNLLYKALLEELISQRICNDNQDCFNALQMYREDGDRIYMNMYAQTDNRLGNIVAKFILENGLKLTGGIPITLKIFADPKKERIRFGIFPTKNEESVNLEVNK